MCLVLDQDKQCIVVIDMSKAYKEICPCKYCDARTVNCHGLCKEYKEWVKNGIEINKRPFFEIRKSRRKKK